MDAAFSPEAAAGSARILLALRHALADPLSTASLKLDLIERRLLSPSGADPAWIVERVRAAQAELGAATRLLDLLLRLAEIAGEQPEETSLPDLCRTSGVPLDENPAAPARLSLRPRASADALRAVASFARAGDGAPAPVGRTGLQGGRATLEIKGSRPSPEGPIARILELPHGLEETEALFVARAAVEADGGRLELTERAGLLVALFSWPVRVEGSEKREVTA